MDSAAPLARILLLFSAGNSPSSGDDGEGPSHVEAKADRKVEGGDMGFTHARAMATVVVATFAVLILTGCSGGESDEEAAQDTAQVATQNTPTTESAAAPGSGADKVEGDFAETRQQLLESGVPEETVEQYVSALESEDTDEILRLSPEIMGASLDAMENALDDLSALYGGADVGQDEIGELRSQLEEQN
ncbi:hypothetical protein [Corynebacterium variabile]|uniref:hypothetical protein n=1 Tax=Corynebacterium variabile TaxID=1727 RepID=UPI0028AB37D3|nr:hypothetical protein [Corynebacterium variabile]